MRSFITKNAIWIVIIVTIFLRLPLLNGSFWLDEAAQILESIRPLSQQLNISEDFQPPLLHIIIHFAALISHSEWWLRTIGALIPAVLSVYFTYKIGERLFSQRTAAMAALLLATSSFHVFYSQELRPYSLATFFALWSWSLLTKSIFKEKLEISKNIIFFVLSTFLGLYSTYLYPYVLLSQGIYILLFEIKAFKHFLLSSTIAILFFIPWLPGFLKQLAVGQQLRIDLPGWAEVVAIPQLKSLPLTFAKFLLGVLDVEFSALYFGIASVLVVSFLLILKQHSLSSLTSKKMKLLYCWFFIPLIGAWLTSFFIPILQPKRVLYILPALYLLISATILETGPVVSKIKTFFKLPMQSFFVAVFFILNAFSLYSYYANPALERENWRAAHQKIIVEYPDNAVVIFGFNTAFAPWVWYDDGRYPILPAGNLVTAEQSAVEAKLKRATEYSYVLVFDYLLDLTDPERKIDKSLKNLGFTEKDIFFFPNIGFIRVYARAGAVLS